MGRSLLNAILSHLNSRGTPPVVLSTAEGKEAAQRLFERIEYRRMVVEMTRELDGSEMRNRGC